MDGRGIPVSYSYQEGINGYTGTNDSTIINGTPISAGTSTHLYVDKDPPATEERAVVRFNLSKVQTMGAEVVGGSLTLWSRADASLTVADVYTLKRNFVEDNVNWTHYNPTTQWQIWGANGTNDRDSTPVWSGLLNGDSATTVIYLNNTVRAWLNGTLDNQGVVLMSISGTNGWQGYSRRHQWMAGVFPAILDHYHQTTETYDRRGL